jgi:hypothetical protein
LSKVPSDAVVQYIVKSPDNTLLKQSFTRQANDSRGFYALQEWIWLPEGYTVTDVQVVSKLMKAEKKGKKRK